MDMPAEGWVPRRQGEEAVMTCHAVLCSADGLISEYGMG